MSFSFSCHFAVKFEDLYKMRAPVGVVEGFDITTFDQVVGIVILLCVCYYQSVEIFRNY